MRAVRRSLWITCEPDDGSDTYARSAAPHFAEDAARVAASLTGELDRERDARATIARAGLQRA